jgi:hypothetical protein
VAPPARKSSPSKAWFARTANTSHGYPTRRAHVNALPNLRNQHEGPSFAWLEEHLISKQVVPTLGRVNLPYHTRSR